MNYAGQVLELVGRSVLCAFDHVPWPLLSCIYAASRETRVGNTDILECPFPGRNGLNRYPYLYALQERGETT